MSFGRLNRLLRLQTDTAYYFLIALDHPLSYGHIEELTNVGRWVEYANNTIISGIVLHVGELASLRVQTRKGIILQLMGVPAVSGSEMVPVATIDDAIHLGVDAVSVQLSIGPYPMGQSLMAITRLMAHARAHAIPTLMMLNQVGSANNSDSLDLVDAIKIAIQLGPDIIKVPWLSKEPSSRLLGRLEKLLPYSPPIVAAGGLLSVEFAESMDLLVGVGFSGVCVGRNIFQSTDPASVIKAIDSAFNKRTSPRL